MATSGSSNFTVTRDDIIKRALRIIGAIGQGETPSTDATTEAAFALNSLVKEWGADGMQLWKYSTTTAITMVAASAATAIGSGATINMIAPSKVTQAWIRNNTSNTDTPLNIITKQEYDMLSVKSQAGNPNQIFYQPPGAQTPESAGAFYLYPVPDATCVAAYKLYLTGMNQMFDFDAAADTADFPSFYYNALAWGLADQLSYEYGVPYSQQAMITKKAETHKAVALSFDREEGSIYLMPDWTGRDW